jgi:hypothetical protein
VTDEIVRVETKHRVLREDMFDPARWAVHRAADADANAELFKQDRRRSPMLTLLRVKGEALHPERYDLLKLARIKRTLSNRFWSALYQQNPVPDDGSFFTRDLFKRAHLPDKNACNVFMTWDFAIKEKQHNDYTVGWRRLPGRATISCTMRTWSGSRAAMRSSSWRRSSRSSRSTGRTTMRIGFEDGQIFSSIEALCEAHARRALFVPYELLTPVTDKQVRAAPLAGAHAAGALELQRQSRVVPGRAGRDAALSERNTRRHRGPEGVDGAADREVRTAPKGRAEIAEVVEGQDSARRDWRGGISHMTG